VYGISHSPWFLDNRTSIFVFKYHCTYSLHIFYQEIKIDNEGKRLSSCKMALYRKYLKCGVKTWETVINALELSKNVNIMKEVKMHLIKDFM